MLIEHGRLEQLPASLRSIIAARLDALPDLEKRLLQDAAVAGKVFWVGALETIGFHVTQVGSYPTAVGRTTVLYGQGGESTARTVARYVAGGAALVQDDHVRTGQAVLVTGTDFRTVHDQPAPAGTSESMAMQAPGTRWPAASSAQATPAGYAAQPVTRPGARPSMSTCTVSSGSW